MSSATEVCFNSSCKETSEKWRRGWRRRTGEYAHLCDRCASAYEDGKFCETFHMNAFGWRSCESCGKQIHCGCIVSFHMFVLLDAGGIECLACAKKSYILAYFPPISHPEGLPLKVQDVKGKEWVFQFRFWPNNNSRMYVLEGITPCIQSMKLQAGDVVIFSRLEPEGKLIMGGRKSSAVPSIEQAEEGTVIGCEASSPGDRSARYKSADVMSVNGHMKDKIIEDSPVIHIKRKNSNLNAKSKRLRIENEDMLELELTYKEAQGLMRAPAKIVPSSFLVDGCEFEEFEEAEPVIGWPTILGMDQNRTGEKIQWVQCEDCFKWRKVPADALVPSKWTCLDNMWDLHRSRCSSAEELTTEQFEQMIQATNKGPSNKEESTVTDADPFVALEGLDTLADLAIRGEGDALLDSYKNRTKHPRHKPGCPCIVCLQPPSGKGTKHDPACDCVVCASLKRRFKTLMERRERKQSEKENESSSSSQTLQEQQPVEKVQDITASPGNKSLNQEEADGRKLSTSTLKGQIDLNIQPEREDDFSPRSDCGGMKFFRQQRSLESDNGVGCVNMMRCVAFNDGRKENS